MNHNKNVALAVALVLIAGAIWYLQANKQPSQQGNGQSIALLPQGAQATTTQPQTTPGNPSNPKAAQQDRAAALKAKAAKYPSAVEIIPGPGPGSNGFVNSGPFTLKSLVGKKVILVDFWTYSCINCQRTIPYLSAWHEKYKDKGLVIVGVHTPEFDFEKEYANVVKGAKDLGVQYPVVQDNNYATWNAYSNLYWPHEYLIDIDGYVVHDKIGEGGYADTERAIQAALTERAQVLGTGMAIPSDIAAPKNAVSMDSSKIASPETYFGASRNEYLANGAAHSAGAQTLAVPDASALQANGLYLGGSWKFDPEFAESVSATAKIVYKYEAKNVYFVASSAKGVRVRVLIDGQQIPASMAGKDVGSDGTVLIKDNRLYNIVQGADYGSHALELQVEGAGLDAFTFTFG